MSACAEPRGEVLVLRIPGPDGQLVEKTLPLPEWQYQVIIVGSTCRVMVRSTDELVYSGLGPVEIVGRPVPF